MASRPVLDQPPPSPANPPGSAPQGGMGPSPGPGPAIDTGAPSSPNKAVIQLGQQLDMALSQLAQAMPDSGGEFSQAKQLIQAGIAKFLQKGPGAIAISPTAPGSQFTGGGMGAGLP